MKNSRIVVFGACLTFALCIFSCREDKELGNARIQVKMHDMPIDFDSVMIDIVGCEIHSNISGWTTLQTFPGIYDLLVLQNGVDTLIVPPQDVPEGIISQVRLILGSDNTAYAGGVAFPLSLSSQDESGLKLNIHQEIFADELYTLVIDFDASQSLHENGNGTWKLRPVLNASFIQ